MSYVGKATFDHNFSVNGETKTYKVANDGSTYVIENTLQEGYIYDITVEDGTVTAAEMLDRGNDSVVMGEVSAVDESSITVSETTLTIDGAAKTWKITSAAGGSTVESAAVQVGDSVKVVKDGDAAKSIYITFVAEEYTAPVSGTPGEKTLKNFLATAMEPVGTALYIYGGTWDWQDVNSSNQAMTIGLSQSWVDFFQSQDANYSYRTNSDHAHSYYPHEAWNQYYYAGIDCSGYVGWAIYNVMHTADATVSDNVGYVRSATGMAGAFKDKGWGTVDMGKVLLNPDGSEWKDEDGDGRRIFDDSEFKVGDIFSMNGHVWICLGTCEDGSIVFMHSTPSDSKAGESGGGVQISAIGPDQDCEAYQLASFYMKAFYPEWSERYDAVLKSFDGYTRVYGSTAGKFSWDLTGAGLTDPDGYADMTPAEILKDLFGQGMPVTEEAVYLGVHDFANSHGDNKDTFQYDFSVNGESKTYGITNDGHYSIQNTLQEGYIYDITVEDGTVTAAEMLDRGNGSVVMGEVSAVDGSSITVGETTLSIDGATKTWKITSQAGGSTVEPAAVQVGDSVKVVKGGNTAKNIYITFVAEEYTAPVSGTPGQKTLKNFLATAMEPVGTSLYIYGGTWDWQDDKSSNQAMTIGLPQSWIDFFQSQDENYTYRDDSDPAHSYYWRHYNEYYYAGPDCSGYAGWVVYNLMHTKSATVSESDGYVASATTQAKNFANEGWGTFKAGKDGVAPSDFKVGDIYSMNGHVWICLGVCDDGSIVFMHSTPNTTNGAGAQISALGPDKECEAYQLANYYMNTYFPMWAERYGDQVLCLSFASYTNVTGSTAGKFSWDLENVLTDPDGYADMTPAEILKDLFDPAVPVTEEAVYLGVEGYGTVGSADKATFDHNFSVNGETKTYKVANDASTYVIENTLQEGYIYDITVEDGKVTAAEMLDRGNDSVVMGKVSAVNGNSITVGETTLSIDGATKTWKITSQAGGSTVASAKVKVGDSVKVVKEGDAAKSIYITFVAEEYTAPVSGTPGQKTLKNFLATAMEPVGTSLYVYGGTWDWQDDKSSNQAMTIGLPQSWMDFFQSQDADYSYKNSDDYAHSYYPHKSWNQYYFAGPDCSGYVGWAAYNLMHTENSTKGESDGYVMSSTKMARTFAETYHWGTWERSTAGGFKVGDIFSMSGHVWICLGVCDDGSIVFMHSTPSTSKNGQDGGGVQISALNPNDTGTDCEAYELASFYMKAYYPEWSERYDAILRDYSGYTAIASNANAGKFSWDLENVLTDPDGYADMTPAEILKDLFGGYAVQFESNGGSVVKTQSVADGGAAAKPANPTRSSYRFEGWYTDSTLKTPYDFSKPVTGNITLYAKWTYISSGGGGGGSTAATTYTVTASAGNGGTISPSGKVSVTKGNAKTFTITASEGYRIADVLVNGKSVGAVSSYTIKDITSNQTISASFARQDGSVPFTDVPENAWYLDGVEYAYENGLLKGTTDTTFSPNATLTRGMLVTILYRMAGSPAVTGQCPFADVAKGSYCEDAVTWAVANGVVNGFTATTFAPNQNVTREQMAAILYRYAELKGYDVSTAADLSAFTDAGSIAAYAVPAVKWANAAGLVQGTTATTINPKGNATRAQVSMILMRFAENVAK
ncbi:S-layer homology domain-containing protein [Oscillibacter sp. MSJ-2]|uniref:S-layer homology domain-containing protein n=1 Tax=Dysosmobacter acutus TaxID=2841504 RepID=A0ABS6F8D8_9FIRM|nr:S-layer homology domain-containing protein [Dysosmobacter acutus]MBU5626556.1 S-layer homology domain-containing protein [Dysosmobacter acutus]